MATPSALNIRASLSLATFKCASGENYKLSTPSSLTYFTQTYIISSYLSLFNEFTALQVIKCDFGIEKLRNGCVVDADQVGN